MRNVIIGVAALCLVGTVGCTLDVERGGSGGGGQDWSEAPDGGLWGDSGNPCDPGAIDAGVGDPGDWWSDAGPKNPCDPGEPGPIDAGVKDPGDWWPDGGPKNPCDPLVDAGPGDDGGSTNPGDPLDAGPGDPGTDAGGGSNCASITQEAVCTVTVGCDAMYSGTNCECYADGSCSCKSWQFAGCE